jgi:transcription factor TFIIIB component B''
MKAFFPGRTVAQIKKKGIRENAKNPEKVTAAINARRPIGMSPALSLRSSLTNR